MFLKRTLSIVLNCLTGARRLDTSGRRALIGLLLAPLLGVGCAARPSETADKPASPLVYAAVGDSTGVGLGARDGGGYVERLFAQIKRKRSASTLLNLSAGGATTTDAINKQLPRLDGTRATLVTVCIGANDLLRGDEVKQFAENYETLVVRLKQPGRVIVVANLPDVASAPALKETGEESLRLRLVQFNKAIEDIAGRHKLPLVDLYQSSDGTTKARPEFFSADGLHPSDVGYAHWAEAMWKVIEGVI